MLFAAQLQWLSRVVGGICMFWRLTALTASSTAKPVFTELRHDTQRNSTLFSRVLSLASPARRCARVYGWPKTSSLTSTWRWTHPMSNWLARQYGMSLPLAPQAGRATMRLHDPLVAVGESGATRTKPLTAALSVVSTATALDQLPYLAGVYSGGSK
jgi:hypothetical protein